MISSTKCVLLVSHDDISGYKVGGGTRTVAVLNSHER